MNATYWPPALVPKRKIIVSDFGPCGVGASILPVHDPFRAANAAVLSLSGYSLATYSPFLRDTGSPSGGEPPCFHAPVSTPLASVAEYSPLTCGILKLSLLSTNWRSAVGNSLPACSGTASVPPNSPLSL